MGLGEAAECHAEQIRSHGSDRDVLLPVHDQTVVNLIGKNHKLMLPGDIHDLLENLPGIQRSGRIVRIDNNDGFRPVGDLFADIVDIRVPVRLLITDIMYDFPACQCGAGRPQRIVRRGNQDLVSVVQQRRHAQIDQFADPVSGINTVHAHIGKPFQLRVLHNRFSGRKQSFGLRITLAVHQLSAHIIDHFVRGTESERSRIPDVQFQYLSSGFLHSHGLIRHRASHII